MYERIGGGPALRLAVEEFYALVLADAELAPYFTAADMDVLKKHQAALLATVLGGPSAYTGRDMADAHAGRGITERHFSLVRDYLNAVLWKLHVEQEVIEAVDATITSLRTAIVEKG